MLALDKDKPIILFGAGYIGKKALDFYGAGKVRFFADNKKAGQYYYGIPILSMEDLKNIKDDYNIIIATLPELQAEINAQLESAGIHGVYWFNSFDAYEMVASNLRLEKFKNIHEGKRCFLIGNGPSLRVEDLAIIAQHGDISFAANKIYKYYSQTAWRPNYFFAVDPHFISQNGDELATIEQTKFLPQNISDLVTPGMLAKITSSNNVNLFMDRYLEYDPVKMAFRPAYDFFNEEYPSFSEDAAKFVYEGFTVVYLMMQWAAYMGFTEIYLLGVDHSFKNTCNYFEQFVFPQTFSPEKGTDHFCDNYHKAGELVSVPDMHANEMAYEKAEQYSREHGFRIYNATRGGNLEIFERVDFDELMSGGGI